VIESVLIIIKKSKLLFISLIIFYLVFIYSNILIIRHNNAKYTTNNDSQYLILIHIDEKKLYLFESSKCIKQYSIASGKPGWPSPIGEWEIIEKGNWGDSFGGRWLGLNVRWGNYGIHGTKYENSIGRAASHGCIRLFNKDIKELYNIVPIGTPVIIKNGPFGPFGKGFRNLNPGDRGADVFAIQKKLKALGYFDGYESGIYEDDLKSALKRFQKDNNLKVKHTITRSDYNAMGFIEFE